MNAATASYSGGAGAEALAKLVVETCEGTSQPQQFVYPDDMPLLEKIETAARRVYCASGVTADAKVKKQLQEWTDAGYGHYPICIAKTQYSFSTDNALKGAPEGHVLNVREVQLSAGAGFVIAICGGIMTMPGLPASPAAERIDIDDEGNITGLS